MSEKDMVISERYLRNKLEDTEALLAAAQRTIEAQQRRGEFLSSAKNDIFDLFVAVRDGFDGSEYQQGKKDGLRTALALLGNDGLDSFNRGGPNENPA